MRPTTSLTAWAYVGWSVHRGQPLEWLQNHSLVVDAAEAVLVSAAMVAAVWLPVNPPGHFRHPDPLAVALVLAQTLPLAWRRMYPAVVVVIIAMATIAYLVAGYAPGGAGIPTLIGVYSLGAHRQERWDPRPLLIFTVLAAIAADLLVRSHTFFDGLTSLVLIAAAWLIGDNLRTRRAHTRSLEERAITAERERDAEAKRAVIEERTRIARELHDVVAHSMSVMVVQAGAARRVLQRAPSASGAALDPISGDERGAGDTPAPAGSDLVEVLSSIESTGRDALAEMRRLLGVLRQDGDDTQTRRPPPTVADIGALVESFRDAGLGVSLCEQGEPARLPPAVEMTAYRIVQEGLTNTLKHAGLARANVEMRWEPKELEIRVSDDGRGPGPTSLDGPPDGRHGLVGMRERVALFGGSLWVGARPGGGFQVIARLPRTAATHQGDRPDV